jgi:hypothetical protein
MLRMACGHPNKAPWRSRSVRYCRVHRLKTRRLGAGRRGEKVVTYERQRDSDGMATISGAIAAPVAQAQRRQKSSGGLRSHKRFEASRPSQQ